MFLGLIISPTGILGYSLRIKSLVSLTQLSGTHFCKVALSFPLSLILFKSCVWYKEALWIFEFSFPLWCSSVSTRCLRSCVGLAGLNWLKLYIAQPSWLRNGSISALGEKMILYWMNQISKSVGSLSVYTCTAQYCGLLTDGFLELKARGVPAAASVHTLTALLNRGRHSHFSRLVP